MNDAHTNPFPHVVYMYFQQKGGWYCQFLEADLKTRLPCKLRFSEEDSIREFVARGGAARTAESRKMLEYALRTGRGGVFLQLTDVQYQRLKESREAVSAGAFQEHIST
jgi:hypothetical protein